MPELTQPALDPERTSTPRATMVPDPMEPALQPDELIRVRASPSPSTAPPSRSTVVLLALDRALDALAIVAAMVLAIAGRVDGPLALAAIGAIAGVGGITRSVSSRRVPGVGVPGLGLVLLAPVVGAVAAMALRARGLAVLLLGALALASGLDGCAAPQALDMATAIARKACVTLIRVTEPALEPVLPPPPKASADGGPPEAGDVDAGDASSADGGEAQ